MAIAPEFIPRKAEAIRAEIVARYEELTGKTLQPAQPEALFFDVMAYRETILRTLIQGTAVQNLVQFSSAPVLDYLGDLVGVTRLPAASAQCTLELKNNTYSDVIIPSGFRVGSADGAVVFETLEEVYLSAQAGNGSTPFQYVDAVAIEEGTAGNGYDIGAISKQIDQATFESSGLPVSDTELNVRNIGITAGGAPAETDEALRTRIILAPNSFSVAGPKEAYRYWTLTASPDIKDATTTTPTPGTVRVFILPKPDADRSAEADHSRKQRVLATLSADNIRPLCDTVEAQHATEVPVTIEANITRFASAPAITLQPLLQAALDNLILAGRSQFGKTLLRNDVITAFKNVPGVYDVDVIQPASNVTVSATSVWEDTGDSTVEITGVI
jgi:phage-related baseplate assembly protein